ncbi:hypothetical protein X801_08723 [Opisthorchis viverrini]|uniref:Uncharacterized protein n=1 Tax=Opisthorchis viverrini TaxID=6198 RepID=A0A1S8WM15_OPIVI|nr:hypothetical protein X801_08723 [Opisthorchis viverrini]
MDYAARKRRRRTQHNSPTTKAKRQKQSPKKTEKFVPAIKAQKQRHPNSATTEQRELNTRKHRHKIIIKKTDEGKDISKTKNSEKKQKVKKQLGHGTNQQTNNGKTTARTKNTKVKTRRHLRKLIDKPRQATQYTSNPKNPKQPRHNGRTKSHKRGATKRKILETNGAPTHEQTTGKQAIHKPLAKKSPTKKKNPQDKAKKKNGDSVKARRRNSQSECQPNG